MVNVTVKRLATGLVLSGLIYAAPALAQSALAQQSTTQQSSKTSTATQSTAKPATTKPVASKPTATTAKKSPPKPLVYVEDNRSAKTADASSSKTGDASASKPVNASAKTGDGSASKSGVASTKKAADASASPKLLSADLTKAFQQNCPSVALTESKAKAAYDVTFEHDPGSKGVKTAFGLHKTNKIEVMSKSGKELFSESGHSTGQLVKDACTAIGTPGVKVAKN
jgi:hypothetical protein